MLPKDQSVGDRGCCYLTFNVTDWTDIFVKPVFKQIIVESLNYFVEKRGLIVYGWCLMTNHLHLIAKASKGISLMPLANEYKSFTSKIILEDIDAESEARRIWILKNLTGRGNPFFRLSDKFQVWQANVNPIYIDSESLHILDEHLEYIHNYPVKDRIVTKPEDYLYSSARDYAGMKGLVNITTVQETTEPGFLLRRISSY
jgi:REP element-mobilizing transposase RayT